MRNTLSATGYLVAVELSVLVTAAALAVSQRAQVLGWFASVVYVQLLALVLGPVGVALVHVTCRGARRQWVHVLAAGLAGLAAGLSLALSVGTSIDGVRHPVAVAVAAGLGAALGRLLVGPAEDRARRSPSAGAAPRVERALR